MGWIRRHFPRRPRLSAVALACAAVCAATAVAQSAPPSTSVRPPVDDVAALVGAETAPGDRAAAARRLLASPTAEGRAAIERTLSAGAIEEDETAPVAVLREIASLPSPPAWVLPAVSGLVEDESLAADMRIEAINALSAFRSRDAVRVLLDQARKDGVATSEVREAAFSGLVRLTGHAEFGADINRWQTWFGQVQWLSEAEWRRDLVEALAARADALSRQRDQFANRLVDAIRLQYLGLDSQAERSERLVELFGDPQPEVRLLGLTLAQQEIANARQLDAPVGEAAAALLLDPSVAIRKRAAEVVSIVLPADRAPTVVDALRRETDPAIAAVLLKTVARWPAEDLTPILVNWLEAGPPAAAPACDSLDAVERRGWLSDPGVRQRTVAALRSWRERDSEHLPASALRLLFVIGDRDDRERVLGMLHSPQPEQRWAAATAASQVSDAVVPLLEAAASDAALFPAAAQAVAAFRPTADGLMSLAALPAPDPAQRRERLLSIAQELDHGELFRAARATQDLSLREAMLARLLREPIASQRIPGAARTMKPAVIAGLLLLSDARRDLGQPAGALAALDALASAADQITPSVLDERRLILLLWLNRIDEAMKMDVGPEAWLDGLERCIQLEHAPRILAAFEARFPAGLPDRVRERLEALKRRLGLEPDRPQ